MLCSGGRSEPVQFNSSGNVSNAQQQLHVGSQAKTESKEAGKLVKLSPKGIKLITRRIYTLYAKSDSTSFIYKCRKGNVMINYIK